MAKKKIYLVDDDKEIRELVLAFLTKAGFAVTAFKGGPDFLKEFALIVPDLVILDIMMPEMDGFAVCQKIREVSNVPIIFLSARDNELDKVYGITLGSDDYITKPFNPMEMVARVKSIFRRIDFEFSNNFVSTDQITVQDLTIIVSQKRIMCNGQDANFTLLEFDLFMHFVNNLNSVVTNEVVLKNIWGYTADIKTRAIDDTIKRIRKKLTKIDSKLEIINIRSVGYKITD